MAYEGLPDLEVLLAPIADDAGGVGSDLRAGSDVYLNLKDLRNEARLAEREAAKSDDPESSPLSAARGHWIEIVERGADVLANQSKDLEVGCWVCEGLVRTDSFTGLAYGLELNARLVEDFWEAGLFPAEEEDGVEDRIAPLSGLFGRGGTAALVQTLKMLPLSDRGDLQTAALWTLETALAPVPQTEDPDARDGLVARQAQDLDAINLAIRSASPAFLRTTYQAAKTARENLARLMKAVDERTGLGGFGSQVDAPLESVIEILEARVGHLFRAEEGADEMGEGAAPGEGGASVGGAPSSRAQALDTINRIADFFERTEPQSVVAKSLRAVVRRANMTLEELLSELLPDPSTRSDFLLRAGIKTEASESDDMYQ